MNGWRSADGGEETQWWEEVQNLETRGIERGRVRSIFLSANHSAKCDAGNQNDFGIDGEMWGLTLGVDYLHGRKLRKRERRRLGSEKAIILTLLEIELGLM